jgi:glycine oxidase
MIDYLIIGQGLAGSVLAWQLLEAGKRVLVINNRLANQASQVAAGLYNPITGRYLVKTWLADQVFPAMEQFYSQVANKLAVKLLYPKPIFRPFLDAQEREIWTHKALEEDYDPYVSLVNNDYQTDTILNHYGGIVIKQAGYIDVPCFLDTIRVYLQAQHSYQEADFDYGQLRLGTDVQYQAIRAQHIIFCEGAQAKHNPFFKHLPFRLVKGELLTIQLAQDLSFIYNRDLFILPKPGRRAIVGATYDWQDLSVETTIKARQVLETKLNSVFKLPYTVLGQQAGIRPATFDRRPWIGMHLNYPQMGIFNGLGTKGVSLAPYLASRFVDYLLTGKELPDAVRLNRIPSKAKSW